MKTSSEYRALALNVLSGKWTAPVLFTLVYVVLSNLSELVCSPLGGFASSILSLGVTLILLPAGWAFEIAFLRNYREEHQFAIPTLFEAYKDDFKRIFTTLGLEIVYVLLWACLFIIPGIVKGYSYAMTSYILEDDKDIENNAAIEKSMAMMEGHKMELFLLDLSFIGWILLSILTCFIGFLWLAPYMETAHAAFYEDLKAQAAPAAEVAA